MPDERLPQRTLAAGFWITLVISVIAAMSRKPSIALGFAVGGGISLISLWSLMVTVPKLLAPSGLAPKLWVYLAFFKLPLYAFVIYFAMNSGKVDGFSMFVGVGIVPMVLVLKAIGYLLSHNDEPESGKLSRKHTV